MVCQTLLSQQQRNIVQSSLRCRYFLLPPLTFALRKPLILLITERGLDTFEAPMQVRHALKGLQYEPIENACMQTSLCSAEGHGFLVMRISVSIPSILLNIQPHNAGC